MLRTRFAPSPTGHLHVGGARTALFCWAYARGRDGRFLLRIEDTDQKRSSDAAGLEFCSDLKWLGIDWDEGPVFETSGGGEDGPYWQSQRLPIYDKWMQSLIESGRAYPAFETPEELNAKRAAARAAKLPYKYDRAALDLDADTVQEWLDEGRPHVIRFRVPDGSITIKDEVLGDVIVPDGELEDFVIRKGDGFPTYHFAVVVDDASMGVTHVIRGQEHLNNTAKHLLLQSALGFDHPNYAHLSLIFNPDGSKMSKRDKDKALRAEIKSRGLDSPPTDSSGEPVISDAVWAEWTGDKERQLETAECNVLAHALDMSLPEINVDDFRTSGYLPEVLLNYLALLGWSPGNDLEHFDAHYLVEHFGLDRVLKSPAKFDRVKLLAFNLDALQAMSTDEFHDRLHAYCQDEHPEFLERMDASQFRMFSDANHERSKTLLDPIESGRFFVQSCSTLEWTLTKQVRKALLKGDVCGYDRLESILPRLEGIDEWTVESLESLVESCAEEFAEGKVGSIAQPLRVAVSGGTISPPIYDTLCILGRDRTLKRIRRCLDARAALAAQC